MATKRPTTTGWYWMRSRRKYSRFAVWECVWVVVGDDYLMVKRMHDGWWDPKSPEPRDVVFIGPIEPIPK
jgi:hypothetical protein